MMEKKIKRTGTSDRSEIGYLERERVENSKVSRSGGRKKRSEAQETRQTRVSDRRQEKTKVGAGLGFGGTLAKRSRSISSTRWSFVGKARKERKKGKDEDGGGEKKSDEGGKRG